MGSYTVTVPANCTTAVVGLWAPGSNGINGNTAKGQNGGSSGDYAQAGSLACIMRHGLAGVA